MVPVVVTANPALQLRALHVVCEVATTYVQAVHLGGQAVWNTSTSHRLTIYELLLKKIGRNS